MDTFEFKDLKTVPDPLYEYPNSLKNCQIPLIIDNGK